MTIRDWQKWYPMLPVETIEQVIKFADQERNSGYINIFLKLLRHLHDK